MTNPSDNNFEHEPLARPLGSESLSASPEELASDAVEHAAAALESMTEGLSIDAADKVVRELVDDIDTHYKNAELPLEETENPMLVSLLQVDQTVPGPSETIQAINKASAELLDRPLHTLELFAGPAIVKDIVNKLDTSLHHRADAEITPVFHEIKRVESDDEILPMHRMEYGNDVLESNLPEGLSVFVEGARTAFDAKLNPDALNNLQVGEYKVAGEQQEMNDAFHMVSVKKERPIIVREGAHGAVVDRRSFADGITTISHSAEGLMRALGYETGVDSDDKTEIITAIPTPDTVKNAVAKMGVEVEFFPDKDYIPGDEYLKVFSQGKYPISTKSEDMYTHDIEDDHLTMMVLGGEPLRDALRVAAAKALNQSGDDVIQQTAFGVDQFTAKLRGTISGVQGFSGEAYTHRDTAKEAGRLIGMSEHEVDQIIDTAQARGRQLGLDVRDL